MWVFFKFEIRAEIAGIEQFLNQIGVIKIKTDTGVKRCGNAVKNDNFSSRYLFVA